MTSMTLARSSIPYPTRQSPTRILQRSSPFTFRHPCGRGFSARAWMAGTIRFFTDLSRRLNSRSAREVMVILYIDLARGSHFLNDFLKRPARFVFAFVCHADQMQVLEQFFVFFDR